MKVSPEMDLILWQLAENGDSGAISRFETTHPALKAELASRVAALEGLRGMKPIPGEAMIPPFKAVPVSPLIPTSWIASGVVAAAVIGTASYFVTRDVLLKQPASVVMVKTQDVKPTLTIPKVETNPVKTPDPGVVHTPPPDSSSDLPVVIDGQDEDGSEIDLHRDRDLEGEAVVAPKYTFSMKEAMLSSIIKALCKDAKLSPEFLPGFNDQKVSVDLQGQTRLGLLKELAQKYGFSAVETGKNEILIVPAPDEGPVNSAEPIGG